MSDPQTKSPEEIAEWLRTAVLELNRALAAAGDANLHVELRAINSHAIDKRYGHDIYNVTVEKREPL